MKINPKAPWREFKTALAALILFSSSTMAQLDLPSGISGQFQADAQSYTPDSLIGAKPVPEKMDMNSYMDLKYVNGNFKAGIRYEAYLNALQGYPAEYKGTGITNRYASYTFKNLEVTAGTFYDQFGSGLIYRTYYDYDLGYDNPMDGVNLKFNSNNGIYVKAFIGKQRTFFIYGPGIVRGVDGELHLDEIISPGKWGKTSVIVGGSFVSKFQEDNNPTLQLPENVGASAGRINVIHGPINLYAEYAYQINDPALVNRYIYRPGESLYLTGTYSKKGLGVSAAFKNIINMNFRSDRDATLNVLNINYMPAISKNQTYRLATIYPNASQPNGEIGAMAEVYYTFKPGTALGGHYGTGININASNVHNIEKSYTGTLYGYNSSLFKASDTVIYKDFNVEITKKFSKKFKAIATYIYQTYNQTILVGESEYPLIYADIAVLDMTYKFTSNKSLRMEFQGLWTKQERGNWSFILAELNVIKNLSVVAYDQWNYGNPEHELRIHYFTGGLVYNMPATRLALSYGKQNAGLLCVGGVCRTVPASNGVTFSISTSF
jgi:hypothetical protein